MDAEPEAKVLAGVMAVDVELVGVLEEAGVAVRRPREDEDAGPRRDLDTGELRPHAGHAELASQRTLGPQCLFDEVRDAITVCADQPLEVRVLAEHLEGEGEEADRRLLAGGEEVGGDEGHVLHVGSGPVRERGGSETRHDVVSRVAAPVRDVRHELVVEELEGLVRHGAVHQGAEARPEQTEVRLGHALQVSDDEEREGAGVLADELALSFVEKLVHLAVGQAPHELLVLAQALGCDEPHEQPPVGGVHRRVE